MNPTILGVIGPGFLNQVPTLALKICLETSTPQVCSGDLELGMWRSEPWYRGLN